MGRIVSPVTITSYAEPSRSVACDALVDTGAAHMVLPRAWREKLGKLDLMDTVTVETADQREVQAEICGPVRVEVEGFRAVSADVVFLEMQPNKHGRYEPLIGYLVLEAIPAAVDMLGHRLVPVKHFDLK
jgi:predicted aspartyl protease